MGKKKVQEKVSYWSLPLLGLIVVGAFLLRVVGQLDKVFVDGNVWFRGVDSWYHMRLVDNMMVNFPQLLHWDMYAGYRAGAQVGYYPLMHWIISLFGRIFDYEVVAAYLPPIVGALTLIPVYFIAKELFHKSWIALLTSLLVAVLPSEFLHRSLLGFTDHHCLEVLLMTTTFLFLILAHKREKTKFTILAGISLGLYLLNWHGGAFILLIIAVWFWLEVLSKYRKNESVHFLCGIVTKSTAIALLISIFYVIDGIASKETLVALGALIVGPFILEILTKGFKDKETFLSALTLTIPVVLVVADLLYPWRSLFTSVFWGVGTIIQESSPITPQVIFSSFGITFFLALGGLYYCIRNKVDTLFIVWSIIILLATIGQRRWGYYSTINIALLASYCVYMVGLRVKINVRPAATVVMCIFMLFTCIQGIITIPRLPNNIDKDWYNSMVWMRENTPDPFQEWKNFAGDAYKNPNLPAHSSYGVLSWWDYGHWIIRIGRRVPISSPTHNISSLPAEFLRAQTLEEAESIIEGRGIRYIVLDESLIGGKFYALLLVEEKNKEKADELRPTSMAMRIWRGEAKGYELINREGTVRIFERKIND